MEGSCIFSKKRETSQRFERHNQFFEETFGTMYPYPQNVEKIHCPVTKITNFLLDKLKMIVKVVTIIL